MSFSKVLLGSIVIVMSIVGFSACAFKGADAGPSGEKMAAVKKEVKVGNPVPDFELSRLNGETVSSHDLEGNPAVIIFWTAWCPSCKEEAPLINKLADEYDGKGVRVVGVDIGEGEARTKEGIKDFGIKYDVVRDADTSVAKSFNVLGTPTIVFIDKNGSVRYIGNELPADYSTRLDALINEN